MLKAVLWLFFKVCGLPTGPTDEPCPTELE